MSLALCIFRGVETEHREVGKFQWTGVCHLARPPLNLNFPQRRAHRSFFGCLKQEGPGGDEFAGASKQASEF